MQSNLLTNTLLATIAALLLVQVIQTGMTQPSGSARPHIVNPHVDGSVPTSENSAPTMQQQPPTNMIFMALKAFPAGCEGKSVLADCSSPAAEDVKNQIQQFSSQNGIRQTFDYIVATWGEKVLTEQALQIRKMRKKSQ
jgi:hypothetical protein